MGAAYGLGVSDHAGLCLALGATHSVALPWVPSTPLPCLGRHALRCLALGATHSVALPWAPSTPSPCLGCQALLCLALGAKHSFALRWAPSTPFGKHVSKWEGVYNTAPARARASNSGTCASNIGGCASNSGTCASNNGACKNTDCTMLAHAPCKKLMWCGWCG
eukprot:364456-Chlamydomonas_euryale.AAC.8